MAKNRILIVEDEEALRDIISERLMEEGYETITASDGQEALDYTKNNQPDLILLDIILPGVDGFELLKEFTSSSRLKDVPIIMITNLGQKKDVNKGLRLGAKEYIIKANFMPDDIVKLVKKHLK